MDVKFCGGRLVNEMNNYILFHRNVKVHSQQQFNAHNAFQKNLSTDGLAVKQIQFEN